jgi:hypothetical protein
MTISFCFQLVCTILLEHHTVFLTYILLLSGCVYAFRSMSYSVSDWLTTSLYSQDVSILSLECHTVLLIDWRPPTFSWCVCFCWSIRLADHLLVHSVRAYVFAGVSHWFSDCRTTSLRSQDVRILLLGHHTKFMTHWQPFYTLRMCVYVHWGATLFFDGLITSLYSQDVSILLLEWRTVFLNGLQPLYTHRMRVYLLWSVILCFWQANNLFVLTVCAYTFAGVSHCALDGLITSLYSQDVRRVSLERRTVFITHR